MPAIRALCLSGSAQSFTSTSFDVIFVLLCYTPIESGGLALSVRPFIFTHSTLKFSELRRRPKSVQHLRWGELSRFCNRSSLRPSCSHAAISRDYTAQPSAFGPIALPCCRSSVSMHDSRSQVSSPMCRSASTKQAPPFAPLSGALSRCS